jgi:hypothetical protein
MDFLRYGGFFFQCRVKMPDNIKVLPMLLKQFLYRKSGSCESDPLSGVRQVRNCYLVGLNDLAGAKDYVRTKIAAYLQVRSISLLMDKYVKC